MLTVGALMSILGAVIAQWGICAMKDPNQPLSRDGSFRAFWGTVISMIGTGTWVVAGVVLLLSG